MGEAKRKKKPGLAPKPPAAAKPAAPAVHSDTLWGGPRLVHNATAAPVFVSTKKEYWELLNRTGWRMSNQQESATGPAAPPAPPEIKPEPIVAPMTQQEAQLYGAMTAVFKRYAIVETLWCQDCFERHRHHGVRMIVSPREVRQECRCGTASYHPPTGTTDTVLANLVTSAVVELDKTSGTIRTPIGHKAIPTIILQDLEADILREYARYCLARRKEPRWFHRDCFEGNVNREANALAMKITDQDIVLVCRCRQLFYRKRRVQSVN